MRAPGQRHRLMAPAGLRRPPRAPPVSCGWWLPVLPRRCVPWSRVTG